MAEGLNLFQLPSIDSSTESRHDTDYYPSNSSPGNSKETIVIDVVNKSDVDFIDLGSTEVLVELRVKNKVNNVNLASTMHAEIGVFAMVLDMRCLNKLHYKREILK